MKRFLMVAAGAALFATPALAQMEKGSMEKGAMASDKGMMSKKMSAADRKTMARCQGMSHDMMMKDRSCARMMKMHPDMMKSG